MSYLYCLEKYKIHVTAHVAIIKKILILLPIAVGFVSWIFVALMFFTEMGDIFGYILYGLIFYLALFLLCLTNYVFDTPSLQKQLKNITKLPPEKALTVLNQSLADGMITEDEYNAKRAEIIAKL